MVTIPISESLNVSIATNIVNIESNANANISNVQQKWTAPEKIWKYDPLVRSEIDKAFTLVYGEGSSANANIIQNVSIVTDMVNSGNLTPALNLVKRKVGANFQGRELDASVFTDIVPVHTQQHSIQTLEVGTYLDMILILGIKK